MRKKDIMGGIVGIDVGGTFTDLFYSRDGVHVDAVLKAPSTPDDPSRGVIDVLNAAGVDPASLDLILHGTTIATNAVIERKGARCALITTEGFRDVLELGRRDRQRMYGMTGVQNPLIPRVLGISYLRFEFVSDFEFRISDFSLN